MTKSAEDCVKTKKEKKRQKIRQTVKKIYSDLAWLSKLNFNVTCQYTDICSDEKSFVVPKYVEIQSCLYHTTSNVHHLTQAETCKQVKSQWLVASRIISILVSHSNQPDWPKTNQRYWLTDHSSDGGQTDKYNGL